MRDRIWTRGRVTLGIEDEEWCQRLAIDMRFVPSWGFASFCLVVFRTGLFVTIETRRRRP